ncbi:flagellar motor stator protein MotA [Thalassotalea sp. PLHSN55]|uniref:flagellar motor stator protein MotA n=1 Tax=Thalassotalea sp. PLHSN55 TaxID=3435888 RepID=UPI003F82BB88
MQKFLGLGIVFLCVFGGFVMANGRLLSLWQPAELVIILGAGLGSMVIANSRQVLVAIKSQVVALFGAQPDHSQTAQELLCVMHALLESVRQKGLKSLDEHIEFWQESSLFLQYPKIHSDPILMQFITDNFRMLSMGKMTAHELESLLEQEIAAIEEDMLKPSSALHTTGEAMPGFGILAAVMGIIITMSKLDGPLLSIGLHVGAALVGTFIGIFMCYCIFEPLSHALATRVDKKIGLLECIKSILVSHNTGKTPLLAVDAGRKLIDKDAKPSFIQMEEWLNKKAA